MKFPSLLRRFEERWLRQASPRKQRGRAHRGSTQGIHLGFEALEDRTLLAVLPAADVLSQTAIGSFGVNRNEPAIAIDPVNPQKLVSVFTSNTQFPALAPSGSTPVTTITGLVSNDGGLTWQAFTVPGNLSNPLSPTVPLNPYPFASDASVAFDRSENFYVLARNSTDDTATAASGALVFNKYVFSGATPAVATGFDATNWKILDRWALQDPVLNPTLAVDSNLPATVPDPNNPGQFVSFADPQNNATQTDNLSGMIYVAWNTNNTAGNPAPNNFNPNVIKIIASADGGKTFTTQRPVNDGLNTGSDRDASPRLAVSQGTSSDRPAGTGGVPGGQLNILWNDFAGDRLVVDRVRNGGVGAVFTAPGGAIPDATRPAVGNDISSSQSFTQTVNILPGTGPLDFSTISDFDVALNLITPEVKEISVTLTAPDGTVFNLIRNRTSAAGSDTGVGVVNGGANLGLVSNGSNPAILTPVGTVFDQQAPRNIMDASAQAPYPTHFRPEAGSLNVFNGLTPSALNVNGVWTLAITDFRNSGGVGDSLVNWSLQFTSKLTSGTDTTVTSAAPIAGAVAAPFPQQGVNGQFPRGIGPAPEIAVDNTLGSFSPFQGRLYVAYVGQGAAGPADNTDIFLGYSDDAGDHWTGPILVNQDNPYVDGFSAGDRSQFQPAITVDQTTGTLVLTWSDARYDAARTRFARFITTSIDGGATFAPETFLNPPSTAFDAITRTNLTLEPLPDNFSATNTALDPVFGPGDRQDVVAVNGKVYAVWAANENGGNFTDTRILKTGILVATATFANGPRVVSSDMGPVTDYARTPSGNMIYNNQFTSDGTRMIDGFVVTFDRPVDPNSFTAGDPNNPAVPSDVYVVFRDPGTPGIDLGENVPVGQVTPLDLGPFGATQFFVAFDVPQGRVGTYSYTVGPRINDRIRSTFGTHLYYPPANQVNLPVPPTGTGGSGIPANDVQASSITVAEPNPNLEVLDVQVNFSIRHTSTSDLQIDLVAPDGRRVRLVTNRAGTNGRDFLDTTIRRGAPTIAFGASPFTGTFSPAATIPAGHVSLQALNGMNPNGTWTLEITDTAALNTGTLLSWSLRLLTRNTSGAADQTGNNMDQNADGLSGEDPAGDNASPGGGLIVGTAPGDVYAVPRPDPSGSHLFTGNAASVSNIAVSRYTFGPPYDSDTLPLIVPGPYVPLTRTYAAPAGQVNKAVPPVGTGGSGIQANDVTVSTLTIAGDPNLQITDLNVNLNLSHPSTRDLVITLIGPDGTQATLVSNRPTNGPVNGPDFLNTTFDSQSELPIAFGAPPFFGRFQPETPLSAFTSKQLAGTWTLRIEDTAANNAGTLNSWSLEVQTTRVSLEKPGNTTNTVGSIHVTFDRDLNPATFESDGRDIVRLVGPSGEIHGPFTITPDPNFDPNYPDPNPTHPRTYRIDFPVQDLGGTYTVTLGPSIFDTHANAMDSNLNAGVDMLRGTVVTAVPPQPIRTENANALTIPPQQIVTSQIMVTDNFLIQDIAVDLDITSPNDPDLEALLLAPDGTSVLLFSRVGNAGTRQNFTGTVLEDDAPTAIAAGAPPFTGRFRPQEALGVLMNHSAAGAWTLQIRSFATSNVSTLNRWALTLGKPSLLFGLGEPVADQASTQFRVFTFAPDNPLARNTWTAVGPAGINGNFNSGRISGIAVDPSDPSGNTVYVGAASGGIWKTTNFLTTDPLGPTYLPLTDFAPTLGLNIGGIAVFGRNSDPSQSIVFAATGEADAADSQAPVARITQNGVGFLRSLDGGLTWTLLDSTVNVDSSGNPLPINSPLRDHRFVGTSSARIVVDPRLSVSGEVIVYAALSGPGGGIYRSTDTGRTWQLMLPGQATDVLLDSNSAALDALGNPTGNLDIVYAALRGQGVFRSPDRGNNWFAMLGTTGSNPTIVDSDTHAAVPVVTPTSLPQNAGGRIVLARPERIPDAQPNAAQQNLLYQGWLYAAAATADGAFAGLYVTKDFGQNWTRIRIPFVPSSNPFQLPNIPTNDTTQPDLAVSGGQGNYNLVLAVDPNNPNLLYLGGSSVAGRPGLIRVDISALSDAHSLFLRNSAPDGGQLRANTTAGVALTDPNRSPPLLFPPPYLARFTPVQNLLQDPISPFAGNTTVEVFNIAQFSNTGSGATWVPFEGVLGPNRDLHRLTTLRDPLTGRARLILGGDQGVATGVDMDGTLDPGIGFAPAVSGSRTGNLQIAQFFHGAAQPSQMAADLSILRGMFYGMSRNNAFPQSDPDILTNGNLQWVSPVLTGDGTDVATDQTGSGTVYQTKWPNNLAPPLQAPPPQNFFQVNGVGFVNQLIQTGGTPPTGDPQWPAFPSFNFAVNPLNGQQIIISSAAGRIFSTSNRGASWQEIASPAQLDGSNAFALAFGAPNAAGGGALNAFLYAGTDNGHIFVRGAGGAGGTQWRQISTGLDGTPVRAIVTDPTGDSHDAYAVTRNGVFSLADASAANPAWVNITGNLFQVAGELFKPFAADTPPLFDRNGRLASLGLEAIVADWRYLIPDNPAELTDFTLPSGPSHPMLYVAGEAGVYRSVDKGQTWHFFPSVALDGARQDGGLLPNVHVTDLDLALGTINPANGRPDVGASGTDLLLATTYGRGAFAIRIAPLIVPGTLHLDQVLPLPSGSDSGVSATDRITNVVRPFIDGITEQTAFGNTVAVRLVNRTPGDPTFNQVIGSGTTDANGHFSLQINAGVFLPDGSSDGLKTIGAQATDDAGVIGPMATFQFTLDTTVQATDLAGNRATSNVIISVPPVNGALVLENRTFLVPGTTLQAIRFDWILRTATFNNEVGIVLVDDAAGRIGNLHPGDRGYLLAALAPGRWRRLFRAGRGSGARRTLTFQGGQHFMVFIVQNDTTKAARLRNPTNSGGRRPIVFFMDPVGNPDHFDHVRIRRLGSTYRLAWEDLFHGGDRDFDDVVLRIRPVLG